jgi:hypothetical protein
MNQTPVSLAVPASPELTATLAPVAHPATTHAPARSLLLDSIWLQLAVSGVIGFLFALLVMGSGPLNPRNIDWLGEDGACHYIGWELFRQDPHWHWPLTHSDNIGYPVGESVALVDVNPWMALVFKPLSSLLPEPFQYFGIEAVLVYALQFFIALRIFRLILGRNLWGVWTAAAFFLIAPPLTFRLKFHYTLSNHWMLLAALLVFFKAQQDSPTAVRRFMISALVLGAAGFATNPYIAFPIAMVMTAAAASLVWEHKLTLRQGIGFLAVFGVTCIFTAYAIGFIIAGGRGYGGHGYRVYSMNLLSPFDPGWFGSKLFPALIPHLERGQYEGYSYLGAGVLLLALAVSVFALCYRESLRGIDKRWFVPLFGCCLVLTLMALTTKITASSRVVVDLDPHQYFSRFLAPLRSSGRLFWVPYYALLLGLLAAPYRFLDRRRANALLACILVLQFVDTIPLRRWTYAGVHMEFPKPLQSPIWHQLGSIYQNLVVLPAWQCGTHYTPGEMYGYRYFGYLATEQKMRTNSYYTARYTGQALDYHCKQSMNDIITKPLAPDTAYIVSPPVATQIAQGPTGRGKCYALDDFILCSPKTDSIITSQLKQQGAPLAN